ncbi:DsbA family oxidoreductase [Breoghania sp. L-A4]|uniref:DsbA family oxidoreductase n=1 Tax=Breoghania sp. L-A4 TaxID=2304600 RepID=UPI000E35FBBD|nr:DsbA family oxidoreductase [Breoghania sp. L-A4]AXS40576.1 DsbA family oxidoreductase [Breoghania sp. L-A4]
MTRQTITVDVVSDVMCPWCYIGKRRLEKAIGLINDLDVTVHWRPFQLDPTLPREGKDRETYLNEKFGGPERAAGIYSNIRQAGETEDLDFQFDKIEVSPNTLDCHRLIRWAKTPETQEAVVERLFKAYFIDGENLSDDEVLVRIAQEAGMDGERVRESLRQEADMVATRSEIQQAQQIGVTGVPCFIIDNKYAVMGAEAASTLADAIRQAANERAGS